MTEVHEPDDAVAEEAEPAAIGDDASDEQSRWAALRQRITRSEAQLEAKYDEAQTHRADSTPIDVAFRVLEADRRFAGGLIAGGMAFRIFVVLVPFAFVIVTVFGFFGEELNPSDPVDLARQLGMTGLIATGINASIGASTLERILTLLVGLYALLWTTWSLVRATRTVHGLAWDVQSLPRLGRPWRPTLWVIAGMLVVFIGGAAVSRLSDTIDPLAEIVVRILLVLLAVAAWVGVSWLLPRAPETTWQSLLPGAVLVGVGAAVLQFLTVYFFSRYIANKTETYGAIGASIAILLWAYLLGRLIVTSAFVNAARWHRSLEVPGSAPETHDGEAMTSDTA